MRLIAAVFALVIAASALEAKAQLFTDVEEAGRWFTYYYLKPEPARLPQALRLMSEKGLLKEDKGASPVTGFLSGVFRANPKRARDLAGGLAFLPEDEQSVVLLGLWYSAIPESKAILNELTASMPSQGARIAFLLATPALPVVEVPPDQGAWVLDAWWGYFFATGDELPVKAVIATLPWTGVQGDLGRRMVGDAARWSLASNAAQHDRVLAICKSQLATQPAEVARLLGEVVQAAEAERAGKK